MVYKREKYLNKLINRKHNGLIKVITGLRRCGKSYLLFNLFKTYLVSSGVDTTHILEIPFDDFGFRKYREPDALYEYVKNQIKDEKKYYILLDEVQLLKEFEDVLNGLLHIPQADVYVTGSNARFLSKDIITEFRGRGDEIHIAPLSFSEFMENYSGAKEDAWREYILYGGLPKITEYKTPQEKTEFLNFIFKETYLSDLIERNKIQNESEFEELINILASSIGGLTNPLKLADTFRSVKKVTIHQETIKKYLDYLEDSFLISKALRYDIKGKSYISTPSKYYFSDTGLRNARLNFRQLEETHLMENVIYNELKIRENNVDVGTVEINYRNEKKQTAKKQLEVDFVCNRMSRRYYIQSALTLPDDQKKEQEETPLKKINDSFRKIIITKDAAATHYTEDGILMINLFDFLLNPDALEF
jgi:uncharacterized protein